MPQQRSPLLRFFLTGLAGLLPAVLTIWLLVTLYRFFDINIAQPISSGLTTVLNTFPWGKDLLDEWGSRVKGEPAKVVPNYVGLALAFVIVFVFGFLLASILGKRTFQFFERFFANIPLIKIIYPSVKRIVDFIISEKKVEFSAVVAFPYPRKGVYSLAFVTGEGLRALNQKTNRLHINVFVPSSPTPFTGYTIFVPVEDVIYLPITVDEAFRFIVSGGVIIPEAEMVDLARELAAASRKGQPTAAEEPRDLGRLLTSINRARKERRSRRSKNRLPNTPPGPGDAPPQGEGNAAGGPHP